MARRLIAALVLQGAVCFGQSPPQAQPAPLPEATPPAPTAAPFERVRELIIASQHLETGGAFDLAQQARSQAQGLLAEQSARLDRERRQLEELADLLNERQIIIQAIVLEAKGISWSDLMQQVHRAGGERIETIDEGVATFDRPDAAGDFVRALHAEQVNLVVLSRPQVVTVDGRQAEIQIGQAVPVIDGVTIDKSGASTPRIADAFVGITIAMTPHFAGDEGIRMEFAIEQSRLEEKGVPIFTDSATGASYTSPIRDVLTAQTRCLIPHDHTWLFAVNTLSAEPTDDEDAKSDFLLVLLQPRVEG